MSKLLETDFKDFDPLFRLKKSTCEYNNKRIVVTPRGCYSSLSGDNTSLKLYKMGNKFTLKKTTTIGPAFIYRCFCITGSVTSIADTDNWVFF